MSNNSEKQVTPFVRMILGWCSFQYLQKLEVDVQTKSTVLISKPSWKNRATPKAHGQEMITKMCHEMDVYVVAEMIETQAQADYRRVHRASSKGQGWLYSKAMPNVLDKV